MRMVYKYFLEVEDEEQVLTLQSSRPVVSVAGQDGKVCLWIEIDTELKETKHIFRVFGTGHKIPLGWDYIGTAQVFPFVWHVYELNSIFHKA